MEIWKRLKKYKELYFLTARNVSILFILVLLLSLFIPFSYYVNMDLVFFSIVLIDGFALLFVEDEKIKKIINYGFLFSLLLVALSSFEFLGSFSSFLQEYQLYFSFFTVILGSITFYLSRNLIDDIEKEKEREEKEEEKRKKNFSEVHPKVDGIPVLRHLLKRTYKEGWWYSVGLTIIVIVGFFLRFWNIWKLSLWGDEGNVFIASKNIIQTGLPYLETGYLYLRDLFHLYITALSLKIFGQNEFAIRFPSIIAGTLMIIFIYLIAKKFVPKIFSLIASLLIAIHPWLIEHSRIGRSYIVMIFFLVMAFYFFIKMTESNKSKNIIFFTLAAIISLLSHQIGQIVLVFFIPFLLLHIQKEKPFFNKSHLLQLLKKAVSFLIIFLIIIISKIIFRKGYYTATDQKAEKLLAIQKSNLIEKILSLIPLGNFDIENILFILNPIPLIGIFTFIFLFAFILNFNKIKNNLKSLAITVLVFLIFVLFSQKSVTINRGILFLFPFFVLIVICGFYFLVRINDFRKEHLVFLFIMALIIFFPLLNTSLNIPFADYGDPIKPYYSAFEGFIFRQDHKTTYEYVNERYREGDIVLVYAVPQYSVMYANFSVDYRVWSGSTLTFDNRNYATDILEIRESEKVKEIIKNNERVWIITSYSIFSSTDKAPRVYHISGSLLDQLEKFRSDLVYQSSDKSARVYFIES